MGSTPCKELQNNSHLHPSKLMANISTEGSTNSHSLLGIPSVGILNYHSLHGIPTVGFPIIPSWHSYNRDPYHALHGIPTVGILITPFMESLQYRSLITSSLMQSLQCGSLSFPSWNPCTKDPYHSLHGIPTVGIPIIPFMESLHKGSLSNYFSLVL